MSSYLITGHIKIPAIWHAFESRFLCILCAWIGDVGYIAQQIGFKPTLKEHSYSKSPVFSRDISSILQRKGNKFIGYRIPNIVGRNFSSVRSKTTTKNRNKVYHAMSFFITKSHNFLILKLRKWIQWSDSIQNLI